MIKQYELARLNYEETSVFRGHYIHKSIWMPVIRRNYIHNKVQINTFVVGKEGWQYCWAHNLCMTVICCAPVLRSSIYLTCTQHSFRTGIYLRKYGMLTYTEMPKLLCNRPTSHLKMSTCNIFVFKNYGTNARWMKTVPSSHKRKTLAVAAVTVNMYWVWDLGLFL